MNETQRDRTLNSPTDPTQPNNPMNETERGNRIICLYVCYVLFLLLFTFFLPLFYLLIMRKTFATDEVLSSHARWQIRTIFYTILAYTFLYFMVTSMAPALADTSHATVGLFERFTFILFIFFLAVAPTIWVYYRAIKGISKLADNKPLENVQENIQR